MNKRMPASGGKKILIVEDDVTLLSTLANNLIHAGFEVAKAKNGEEGLKIVKRKKIDLVLLDLMLPKMPGEQVLKEMQESGLTKKIPVIILSVKGNEANKKNCLEVLGAVDYLTKSEYTLKKIIAKINKILE